MIAMEKIKLIAVMMLMLCFFLPLSTCSMQKVSDHTALADNDHRSAAEREVLEYVPIEVFREKDALDAWPMIVLFFFPIPFLLLQRVIVHSWLKVAILAGELIVAGISAWYILMITVLLFSPLFAGYVALVAIASYCLITLLQLIKVVVKLRRASVERKLESTG